MTCFRLKISFSLPKFLRGSNKQNRGKKIDENTEDYVDFHWRFLDPAADRETRTTELDQLPGLSDYQKILRFFLSQEEAEAEDRAGSEDASDEDMAMLKSKMMPSDEWRIRPRCERTTAQMTTSESGRAEAFQQNEEDEQFRDVSKFLSGMHHDCPSCCQLPGGGDDLLHYACVDVTAPRQRRPSEAATNGVAAPTTAARLRPIAAAGRSDSRVSNLSFERMRGGAASGWEVTRRPQIRTRASSWV